jgi:hypothetical protein
MKGSYICTSAIEKRINESLIQASAVERLCFVEIVSLCMVNKCNLQNDWLSLYNPTLIYGRHNSRMSVDESWHKPSAAFWRIWHF